jgi:hypothetical protein
LKITLALYGVVLISNLALRHAVLGGAPNPWGLLRLGFLLLVLAMIWAMGLFVWLLLHRKRLSNAELAAGWLSVGFAVVLFVVFSVAWSTAGA